MVASSVVLTVVILNFHHRNAETHDMPNWVKTIFLQWFPWILRMHRPGKEITLDSIIMNRKLQELKRQQQPSKSLMSNVLDDDDLRTGTGFMRRPGMGPGVGFDDLHSMTLSSHTSHPCLAGSQRELALILKEIRFITDRMRKNEEDLEVTSDWKFAAMVLDRICLIIFTLFTVVATVVVFLSAPHLIISYSVDLSVHEIATPAMVTLATVCDQSI
ncbi:unnamed protein product [Notodromas monacha]|uniref:Neurotransmitter-gated ion-channel transmembrane domain-containing protein n=1 Tax=Notodromas monacha TaxID=399045 RepID=A0A7R9G922_9CRUS|nr:unnamed protein product [Notodromas monacha]CAG0912693.1 unnamed protein product [Notodromas monacha]